MCVLYTPAVYTFGAPSLAVILNVQALNLLQQSLQLLESFLFIISASDDFKSTYFTS
jgi:hypothetical protein